MTSPYIGLPARSFWKSGVVETRPETITDLHRPKFTIDREMEIATAGSCFAQHIARNLRARGFNVLDAEPSPPHLSDAEAQRFGYKLYSARYGNIYCVRQLLQITQEAYGKFSPALPVWERDGRFFDAMRPSVEPNGLKTHDAVMRHRASHLAHVRSIFKSAKLIVFTLGLTEAWIDSETGTTYPTAPGTLAGTFDPTRFEFKNFTHAEILSDFLAFRALVHRRNPGVQFLLTVSPVPLTATASRDHVLSATTYSKSVLRGVAGELAHTYDDIDYFPSYEMIATPFSRGAFYADNLRSVQEDGVHAVMRSFFSSYGEEIEVSVAPPAPKAKVAKSSDDVVCEDALLEAFAR